MLVMALAAVRPNKPFIAPLAHGRVATITGNPTPLFGCGNDSTHLGHSNKDNPLVDAWRSEDEGKFSFLQRWCLKAIAFYQRLHRTRDKGGNAISRYRGVCAYFPSCSSYTAQAIREFGALKGILKGAYRIFFKCNPLTIKCKTGKFLPGAGAIYDPVKPGDVDPRIQWNQRKSSQA